MDYFTDKNKRRGLIATALIHVLVLILFLFTGLTIPVPLPEDGILVNFGTSDEGVGDVQTEETATSDVIEEVKENIAENTPEPSESVEDVITQSIEKAPAIKKISPTNVKTEPVEEIEPEPQVNPAALYTGKKSVDVKSSSQGETGNPGDQGSLDGSENSKNYGNSSGSRLGFFLAGRNILFKPKVEQNTQETGKVVVNIWVDRYGKVVRATPGAKGTTVTNLYLHNIAKKAALEAKFSANRDAPEEQKGTIVFEFTVKQ